MPYSESYRLGQLIRSARERLGRTQAELADAVGVERTMISQIELGRPKKPIDPVLINRLSQVLMVPAVELVIALGYDVRFEGVQDEGEVALLDAYRSASDPARLAARAALGLPQEHPPTTQLPSLRRLAATDRQGRQGIRE